MRFLTPGPRIAVVAFPLALSLTAGALDRFGSIDKIASGGDAKIDFMRQVRPILAQHCFQCHGPDDAKRKGKLRLDVKDDVFSERKEKHVVSPGSLDDSIVYERITTDNDKKRMPPADKGTPLTQAKIDTLKTWIEQGAEWTEHWAFQPPHRSPAPEVTNKSWVRDPIDAFILARLEKEGLTPNEEATKESWLRRVTFDLTGMPPTIQELDEFAKDSSENAYEKQVDRLLASTRYGERQAQDWLDLARYADTGGYQNDSPRSIWKWREWVVKAYNANKPFDEFTIEQLAGDMLPNATLDQKVATGFNRNHPTNSEAGEEEDEYRSVYVIDRVNTTATVWMGLTLACTQCHDHKYDPISQKDYYSFYSFFNNVKERDTDGFGRGNARPSIPVPNPDQAPRLAALQGKIKSLEKRLEAEDPLSDADQKEWEKRMIERVGNDVTWTVVEPIGMLSRNGSILKKLDDGSILSTGAPPVKDTYDIVVQPGKRKITAFKLEVIPDESLPKGASGRASDGRFVLSGVEIRNTSLSESQDPPMVVVARGDADVNQKVDFTDLEASFEDSPSPIEGALDVKDSKGDEDGMGGGRFGGGGWSLSGDAKKERHDALLLPRDVLELNDASVLRISMHHSGGRKFKSTIGRFRISFTEDERVRTLMLPLLGKAWSSLGPFPAEDVDKAYETAFTPEADIAKGVDTKKSYPKIVLASAQGTGGPGQGPGGFPGAGGFFGAKGVGGGAKEGGEGGAKKPGEGADKGANLDKAGAGDKEKKSDGGKSAEDSSQKAPGLLVPKPPAQAPADVKVAKADEGDSGDEGAVKEDTVKPDGQAPSGKKFGGKGFGGKGGFGPGAKAPVKPAAEGDDAVKVPMGDGEKKFKKGGKLAVGGDKDAADAEKDGDVKSTDGKGADGKSADGKVADVNTKDGKPAAKDGDKPSDDKSKEKAPRKKDEKITWSEQGRWRDGSAARLEGRNVAYYLTRKIQSEGPRVATLQIDGPAAVKVWLNGELVHSSAPVPPPAPKKKETPAAAAGAKDVKEGDAAKESKDAKDSKDAKESKDAKDAKDPKDVKDADKDKEAKEKEAKEKEEEPEEEPEFDFADFVNGGTGRGGEKDDKSFKLGFRAGENELVVKAVFGGDSQGGRRGMGGGAVMFMGPPGMGGQGGGGSFTFKITPEGDDVLNHEVIVALRREAEERNRATPSGGEPVNPTEARSSGTSEPVVKTQRPGAGGGSGGMDDPDDKKPAPKTDATFEGKVGEIAIEQLPEFENEKVKAAKPKLTAAEQRKKVIREYYRTRIAFAGKAVYDEVQRIKAEETKLKREIPETMVMEEREKPRQAYVFKRGLYKNRGDAVSSDVPSVLPPMASDVPKNRLGLAQWLVSPNHPLTSRVTVNRVWKQYFGSGLVRTHEDFGIRGELPTHPELLDTLAVDFVEGKWDMKALHKRIVLSATYRQAAMVTPEKLEKDPENVLLSRGPRVRLTAEMVRDNALSVSGLLFEKIGGESVRPFQPTGISNAVTGGRGYRREKGENQYRRGLYVFWKRGAPYPSMLTFDSAKRDACTVTRPETTTPMQSLVLLNDPVYVECAKMFGQRMVKTGGKDDLARLKFGFRLSTSREPNEKELEVLQKLLTDERAHYKADAAAAKKLLGVGDAKVDESLDAAEIAAWANVGSALLNLDATIHKG